MSTMQGPFATWTGRPEADIERAGGRPMEFSATPPPTTLRGRFAHWARHDRAARYVAVLLAVSTLVFLVMVRPKQNWSAYSKLQSSYARHNASSREYRVAIISDKDTGSKNEAAHTWESDLMLGTLTRDPDTGTYSIAWDNTIRLSSQLNENGRAMELSELVHFNGKLLAFDDRTGLVAEIDIEKKKAIPIHILMEGDGHTNKGQKNEWATVKDGKIYVGSIGKEWTNDKGEVLNFNNQWIKTIDSEWRVQHLNWRPVFESIREVTGTTFPGYVIHEAVCWNPAKHRWYFMPRHLSAEKYDDVADEARGSNIVVSYDEKFGNPKIIRLGPLEPTHGFSTCKFVPFRENEVVALKTMEYQGETKSFITVMNLDGKVLMPETFIANVKFEGFEFI